MDGSVSWITCWLALFIFLLLPQMVRWSSHEFYLIAALRLQGDLHTSKPRGAGAGADDADAPSSSSHSSSPSYSRTIAGKVADTLLDMQASFDRIMGSSEVTHFRMDAACAIGSLFASYDCGRFLTGLSGK